ncbi:hypothetical protein [Microvirga sp. KLBC 81]|uniref:hypothetical protein n=1 Tax=Microvirga sp. KLBC 81 TaxID=1862707 RepID=UPI0014022576|nr:hypothetical protein [Microvirga sp. KLBC 81]
MEYRELSRSGLKMSVLGLSTKSRRDQDTEAKARATPGFFGGEPDVLNAAASRHCIQRL